MQFFILFSETLLIPKLNHGFRKIALSIKASLSEPYSTVWRQPIIFKLLRADWPPPRNRRSGTRRLAPNCLTSSEFLRGKFKFLRGVSEFSRANYHFKLFSTWPTRWLYLSLKPHVKGGLFPLSIRHISKLAIVRLTWLSRSRANPRAEPSRARAKPSGVPSSEPNSGTSRAEHRA